MSRSVGRTGCGNDPDNPECHCRRRGIAGEPEHHCEDVHLERRPTDFKPTSVSDLATWYKSLLESSEARAWVAEQDGLPVGYVLALVNRRGNNPFCPARQWWEIDQIAVDPRFRRRGIGRALILRAIAEAKTLGIADVEAQSWSFNQETHQMLRDVGFVPKTVRFELRPPRE